MVMYAMMPLPVWSVVAGTALKAMRNSRGPQPGLARDVGLARLLLTVSALATNPRGPRF